jgi:hypothetical protein
MPYYQFKNRETGEVIEQFMKISELDKFREDNPNLDKIPQAPGVSDPVRLGLKKPSDGFRDVLGRIRKNNPGSKINTFK